MIQLSGLILGKDIEIVYTGLRPGEKLYEELLNDAENCKTTHHPKIMIANERAVEAGKVDEIVKLIGLIGKTSNMELVKQMKVIVPEFVSNNSIFSELDNAHKN
jgi:FlaA1/EpsC-like NDP-sugar epimerase